MYCDRPKQIPNAAMNIPNKYQMYCDRPKQIPNAFLTDPFGCNILYVLYMGVTPPTPGNNWEVEKYLGCWCIFNDTDNQLRHSSDRENGEELG